MLNKFLGRDRRTDDINELDFYRNIFEVAWPTLNNLTVEAKLCYDAVIEMLKELAESKEKLLKSKDAKISGRSKRTIKEEQKVEGDKNEPNREYYKNATDLFEDKTIALLYVLMCKWRYRAQPPLDKGTLIAVQEIHAVAMDSIRKMNEGAEKNAFREVLLLLDKKARNTKKRNN